MLPTRFLPASRFVLALSLLAGASLGCGGAVAPSGNGEGNGNGDPSSGSTSSSGSSGSSGSGAGSSANVTGSPIHCTPGNYGFCRCDSGAEGTKQCLASGAAFAACACDDVPPPPSQTPCSYPTVVNPPGCPATYSHAYDGQPCDTLNLACTYPGQGDGDANCASTAALACRVAPGGAMSWVATQ